MYTAGERVLIVDEYAPSRIALTRALARRGHACMAVMTAQEALAAVAAFSPTIAVVEWAFRDGSGIGLAEQLRERARVDHRHLLVIALSHANEPAEGRETFDEYLVKPTSADELEKVFARHSAGSRQFADARTHSR